MSYDRSTPIGTPVVLAPGRVVLVGEYAALADGSTIEAAFGCYAKAQFIPQTDAAVTAPLLDAIVERIHVELAELAPALPPGTLLLTNEEFRVLGSAAAGVGAGGALAVAAVGAVLESLGLALEARKPLVFRIADAVRHHAQGFLSSRSDTAAATYGGLIRTGRMAGGQHQPLPLAAPAGLHLAVFAAGPSRPPADVAQALQRYAGTNAVSFLETVAQLRELARRFLDEVSSGQATAAIAAAGKYGEVLQGLCDAAQAPIMNKAFTRAAALARELGGIAKPTGAGNGEIGVALFATRQACAYFREACAEPLVAFAGELDAIGVRCAFPDNAVVADLDEGSSTDLPGLPPDEFDMPTVKSDPPVPDFTDERDPGADRGEPGAGADDAASAGEDATAEDATAEDDFVEHTLVEDRTAEGGTGVDSAEDSKGEAIPAQSSPADEPVRVEPAPPARPARRPRWVLPVLIGLLLAVGVAYLMYRRPPASNRPPVPPPASPSLPSPASEPAPSVPAQAPPFEAPATANQAPPERQAKPPSHGKDKRGGRATHARPVQPRAGRLSPADF